MQQIQLSLSLHCFECISTCEDSFSKTSVDFIVLFYSPALLTALFSFAASPPCPSSFLLFAGSETRQNERMWDRQAWNGGRGLWGVCDCAHVSLHLYFVHICRWHVHVRDWTNIFLSRLVDMYMQKDAVNISMCILMFIFTRNNKVVNSFWNLNPFFMLVISAWTRTHTHQHVYISTVPPWYPEQQLCLLHCKGGVL